MCTQQVPPLPSSWYMSAPFARRVHLPTCLHERQKASATRPHVWINQTGLQGSVTSRGKSAAGSRLITLLDFFFSFFFFLYIGRRSHSTGWWVSRGVIKHVSKPRLLFGDGEEVVLNLDTISVDWPTCVPFSCAHCGTSQTSTFLPFRRDFLCCRGRVSHSDAEGSGGCSSHPRLWIGGGISVAVLLVPSSHCSWDANEKFSSKFTDFADFSPVRPFQLCNWSAVAKWRSRVTANVHGAISRDSVSKDRCAVDCFLPWNALLFHFT